MMKNYKYILVLFITLCGIVSCDFEDVLTETPKDFFSPENSFTNEAAFESAMANIYLNIRDKMYARTDNPINFDMLGIDLDITTYQTANDVFKEQFYWNTLNADNSYVEGMWTRFYYWIYQANVIIDRADEDVVSWESEEAKNAIVGEAKFLRAFAYHFLANLWGGVPLVLHETTSANFDYTRSTQEEVYQQCKEDLEFAVEWMKTVDELEGGRAPRAAAYHLLTEVNICLEDYEGAISAASQVIDDPNFSLMTERFGVRTDFEFNGYDYQGEYEVWGDVYWDLFREDNMNWIEGNHEAIWNVEFDPDVLGGGNDNSYGGSFGLERWLGTLWWQATDINGDKNWLKDTLSGRAIGRYVASDYVDSLIWQYKDDWDRDIRNSKYNVQRTYYWVNPSSEFYGQPITMENIGHPATFQRYTRPYFKKVTPAVHHGLFQDGTSGENHDNGRIFKDWYLMRLTETYLLRAEAYLGNGDLENAAADINVVRNRANATSVVSGDVTIDLILDERARELWMEEFRLNTLMRLEKTSEYLMKYNLAVISNGYNLDDHLNKFPIPNSEIEANKEAELTQNPGY